MGQEAIVETLPSWIGFLGGPCFQPRLNGRLACQQMLCSGISVSLLGYKSPFPQDKRARKKKKHGWWVKGVVVKQGWGETFIVRYVLWCLKLNTWHSLSACFWPSEHVSRPLSSVGISSVAAHCIKMLRARHKPVTWHKERDFFFPDGVGKKLSILLTYTQAQNQRNKALLIRFYVLLQHWCG